MWKKAKKGQFVRLMQIILKCMWTKQEIFIVEVFKTSGS